jgi:hypothetical protein
MEVLTFTSPITTSISIPSDISIELSEVAVLTQSFEATAGVSTSISLEVQMYDMEVI